MVSPAAPWCLRSFRITIRITRYRVVRDVWLLTALTVRSLTVCTTGCASAQCQGVAGTVGACGLCDGAGSVLWCGLRPTALRLRLRWDEAVRRWPIELLGCGEPRGRNWQACAVHWFCRYVRAQWCGPSSTWCGCHGSPGSAASRHVPPAANAVWPAARPRMKSASCACGWRAAPGVDQCMGGEGRRPGEAACADTPAEARVLRWVGR